MWPLHLDRLGVAPIPVVGLPLVVDDAGQGGTDVSEMVVPPRFETSKYPTFIFFFFSASLSMSMFSLR